MPTPEPQEVVQVRRAAGLASRTVTESLISGLNDAEWDTAKALAVRWVAMDDKFAVLDGKVKLNPSDKRNAIRHELRTLLGLSPYSDEEAGPNVSYSEAVPVETW